MACVLVASCSTTTASLLVPLKVYEPSSAVNSDWPVIWTENALKRFSVITKIDGKSFGSRPYAIAIPPGGYKISVYSLTRVDMPSIQSTPYTEFDIDVIVEAGHSYVIRHEVSADGRATRPYLEDMGEGKSCEYVTGQKKFPIFLDCRSAVKVDGA